MVFRVVREPHPARASRQWGLRKRRAPVRQLLVVHLLSNPTRAAVVPDELPELLVVLLRSPLARGQQDRELYRFREEHRLRDLDGVLGGDVGRGARRGVRRSAHGLHLEGGVRQTDAVEAPLLASE